MQEKDISPGEHSDHAKYVNAIKDGTVLPASYDGHVEPTGLPYGAPENVVQVSCPTSTTPKTNTKHAAHAVVQVRHLEGHALSFLCENSSSLSMAPRLIEYRKILASDPRATKKLKMNQSSATYKIVSGIGHSRHLDIVSMLNTTPFSVNLDECTSKTGKCVFSIIVMYLDKKVGRSVVQNYRSFEVASVKAKILSDKKRKLCKEDEIPLKNLVSNLSYSTNYMRCKKGGLEKHLLDINGATCHHMHNSSKMFCKVFIKYTLDDIHNDTKWLPDM